MKITNKFLLKKELVKTEKRELNEMVRKGYKKQTRQLLESGAVADEETLEKAILSNDEKMVKMILDNGVKINSEILNGAIINQNVKILELLLNHTSPEDWHLAWAVFTDNINIVKMVLNKMKKDDKAQIIPQLLQTLKMKGDVSPDINELINLEVNKWRARYEGIV